MGDRVDAGDANRVIRYVATRALAQCGADHSLIFVQGRGDTFRAWAGNEANDLERTLGERALADARTSQRPVRRRDRKTGRYYLALPFKVPGAFTGAICLVRLDGPFNPAQRSLAEGIREFLTTTLENVFLRSRILTDQLTGLCNSDYFRSLVGRELDFARQSGRNLALVLIDVDNFGQANQQLGRRAADEILVRVGRRIAQTLASQAGLTAHRLDLWLEPPMGRFAGDEFAFLLFDVGRDQARRIAEQVLAAAREDDTEFEGRKLRCTVSAGIAMFPTDAADLNKLFIKAYHALYTAKLNGKDRCGLFDPSPHEPPASALDLGELSRSPRGRILAAAVGAISTHGTRIQPLVHALLHETLKAVPCSRAQLVLFDDQDRPRYTAREGAWGEAPVARTRHFDQTRIRAILENEGRTVGIIELERSGENGFSPEDQSLVQAFAARVGPELDRSRRLFEATTRLRELEEQVRQGLRELQHRYTFGKIIGRSRPMQDLFLMMEKVCSVDYPVIVEGETGVGKELVAKAIHFNSRRRDRSFLPVNCAAVSETLLESELFGHEKGAFTGAERYKPGLFELAAGGTLFIDEIEEMSHGMQKKLLRVLEEKQVRPVGGKEFVPVDVRVIASTNRELDELLRRDLLREDLYYRLSPFVLRVPPLRERAEDVPLIAEALLGEIAGEVGGPAKPLSPSAVSVLMGYSWPGNVRELRNELRKVYVLCDEARIEPHHLSVHIRHGQLRRRAASAVGSSANFQRAIQDFERSLIADAMELYQWNISRASEGLGMARNTLKAKLRAYGLQRLNKEGRQG